MSSQQLKPSMDTASHQEPKAPSDDFQVLAGFTNEAPQDRMSKQSLNPASINGGAANGHKPPASKTPTGLAPDPLNILILGASFGGLSCAHHFLDSTLSHLHSNTPKTHKSKSPTSPTYRLVIVSPSTHIYWNIGAPRALVAPGLIKHEDAFIPIEPGFHRHRGERFTIVQGVCVGVDLGGRCVKVEVLGGEKAVRRCSVVSKRGSRAAGGAGVSATSPTMANGMGGVQAADTSKVQTIPFHALIMATGSSAHSDLLSLHGPHLNTIGALNAFHAQVAQAKSIVVCGGGCSGVETAGQLATYLNYSSHWPVKYRVKSPKQITLITGSERCLPALPEKMGRQAENQLRRLGVEVRHGVRVVEVKENFDLTGQTSITLNDETSLIADLYIPCPGVGPNSAYVPAHLRDERGYVRNNAKTMRVDDAGPRVYALGDVASYSQNYVLDVYAAVPVLMHNLLNDLLAHELRLASPYGGNQDEIDALVDEEYVQRHVDSQLCPITRFGGVGILMDKVIPKRMVFLLKGHDYRVCKARMVTVDGGNPYAVKTVVGNKYE